MINSIEFANKNHQILREQVRNVLVLKYNKDIAVVVGQGNLTFKIKINIKMIASFLKPIWLQKHIYIVNNMIIDFFLLMIRIF